MSIPSAGGAAEKLCDRCGVAMGASTDGRRTLYEPLENEDVLTYDADAHATVTLARRPDANLILSSARLKEFAATGITLAVASALYRLRRRAQPAPPAGVA